MESKVFTKFDHLEMRTCAHKVPVLSHEEFKELLTLELSEISQLLKGQIEVGIAKVHPNEQNRINKKMGAEVAISRLKVVDLNICRMTLTSELGGRKMVRLQNLNKDSVVDMIYIKEWNGKVRISLDLR